MYDFYLDRIMLPVAPNQMEIRINNQNRTVSLINFGEVNILRKAGLTDISFTCLIPQSEYPFAVYMDGFQPASFFLDAFEELKTNQEPFQFIVSRVKPNGELLFDSNIKVSLEDYVLREDWENGFDLEVEIRLKQYAFFGTKKVEILEQSPDAAQGAPAQAVVYKDRPPEDPPVARSHIVVPGDNLWEIARRYLGDGGRWREIQNLNPHIAERNLGTGRPSYTIFTGQVINLPDVQRWDDNAENIRVVH